MSSPVLLAGKWQPSLGEETFQATNPATMQPLAETYPISTWPEIDKALAAAHSAFEELRKLPDTIRADFLERFATRIENRRAELVQIAHTETALPVEPRLNTNELPRTVDQLRQAAKAIREKSWQLPTIDAAKNIRSLFLGMGPVFVLGPNNFPFAYNGIAGGDFASAIAAGCPVLAKGHPAHPGTTKMFAEEAHEAAVETGLPPGTVQLLFQFSHEDSAKLVADPRITSVGFTGSKSGGLAIKAVADKYGKPTFLEMGSLNPVVILPGVIREKKQALVDEVVGSCLMGMGQFCTNPGLLFFLKDTATDEFILAMREKYKAAPIGTLLTEGVQKGLQQGVQAWQKSGATLLEGGSPIGGTGYSHQHSLLQTTGDKFLANSEGLQQEAFGNATLAVVCKDIAELQAALRSLEGQLCGCIYSQTTGEEENVYSQIEPILRLKVGRFLNDKMPTGVAVTGAMNHGGPFPATGHPHFTAVGFPASIRRFCMLACYDNVRPSRLPKELQG